ADTQGYKWKQLLYNNVTPGSYNPDNMISTAFAYDAEGEKLFLAVPRKLPRVPYTLAEVDTKNSLGVKGKHSPLLNKFSGHKTGKELTSIYQPVIDDCRRLWVVDIGSVEYRSRGAKDYPSHRPAIVAYDLKQPNYPEVVRYYFPTRLVEKPTYFGGFAVDVANPKGDCSETFVYITNFLRGALFIYDHKKQDSWNVTHPTFKAERPTKFDYGGKEYEFKAGIFGITLGDRDSEGNRPAYYLAGSAIKVYSVNTKELKQKGGKLNPELLGNRGKYNDAIALAYDPKTKVIFFAEANTKQVSCWNTQKMPLRMKNTDVVYTSSRFVFGTDISVDSKGGLWFMSNGFPPIRKSEKFKYDFPRYRLMRIMDTQEAIAGTACDMNA
nr:Chain A, 43.2 kDa salivary protein [Lutzomyia longipalpis]3Q6K_B Chain B, 43.2 kDa salivary protein [Lutzomyia longipalpis]3Q6T_A Chain A, 43.2 kDa salivary protein [Lutzomyia longipalpis]3Q6T_B Chain B, 43.2 kDa salivary protein [Lutzomyia longipalpis]